MNMIEQHSPAVTVCIPVYNCEQFVGSAIESVLIQSFTDFELIILNNASTDNTAEVIRRYRDTRIRIIENETNVGAAGNWNKALAVAHGKYLKIVCADDVLYPSCLARQVEALEAPENSGVAMACCGRDVINEKGTIIMNRNFRGQRGRISGLAAVRKMVRNGTNFIGEPTAALFRTDVIPGTGGFNAALDYAIDFDYWCRLLVNRDLYVYPDSLSAFRVSARSWSVAAARSQSADVRMLIDQCARDRRYRLTTMDVLLWKGMSILNNVLRKIFYMLLLKKSA